jgi:hypothetical protein
MEGAWFCGRPWFAGPAAQGFRCSEEKGYEMKIGSTTVLAIVMAMSPMTLLAETQTYKAEGVKVIGAGSWNPPNAVDQCNAAKQDATKKAASAGFKGRVVWDHLSVDSDCKLSTTHAGSLGWYYTMTAKGTFYKS